MLMSHTTAHVQHLLDSLRAGDDSAREALLECSLDRLHELAQRMFRREQDLRSVAQTDDVLQKALLRLHTAMKGIKPQDVRAYYGLAARQIRWVLRDLAGERVQAKIINYTATPPEQEDYLGEPSNLMEWSAFHETIETLDEESREMFDLLFYEGLTQEEAAEVLQTSIRTVRRRWQRARLMLERALHGDWPRV
jgi:RNA polymerase sigma factor (sigma-70 family)